MAIREFKMEQDLNGVLELWANAGPGVQLSPSDEPEEIKRKLERDPDLFLVDERHGQIAGVVLGGYDGRRGMVYHLAVAANFRRQGIARELMQELEKRLLAKGCLKYYLLVTTDNHAAIDFYRQLGVERMGLHVLGRRLR